ncbi:MAG: hypothetical protein WA693_14455, partial [Pseudolabrys sp.]
YKEPKSGRARTVALSLIMIEELRAHRVRQAQELLKLGARVTDDTFVVAQADAVVRVDDALQAAINRRTKTIG